MHSIVTINSKPTIAFIPLKILWFKNKKMDLHISKSKSKKYCKKL